MKKDPIFTGAALAIITPIVDGSVNYDEFAGLWTGRLTTVQTPS